jgi:cellulose synthase (UDP-forming)
VTDVIDGSRGADAQATGNNKGERFSALTVGNTGIDSPDWLLDDLLAPDAEAGTTSESSGQASSGPVRRRRAPRIGLRARSARVAPSTGNPEERAAGRSRTADLALASSVKASTDAPQAPSAAQPSPAEPPEDGTLPLRPPRTEMLRVAAPPKAAPADKPKTAGPLRRAASALRLTPGSSSTALAPDRSRAADKASASLDRMPAPKLELPRAGAAVPAAPVASNGQSLPVPPLDEEKDRYVKRRAVLVTVLGIASAPLLLYSQIRLMIQYHWFWIYSPFLLLTAVFLALPLLTDAVSRGFDFKEHQRLVAAWHPAKYPSVDVFLPVCGEPIEVLRNTWHYVAQMSRHYQGTVTAYVLDDSRSPELKAMAHEFGFAYATRPNRGWFKKSGNLWFGYQVSYGEYILLLDADFAPRHDFLDEVVPYMDAYPDIGIVQTPQYFRVTDDQTWVERGAGATQELFYRSIQAARARKGGSICVGSCAVYRREALKENLGMTLAEHSEDMLTGYDLKSIGWRLHYIPVALSTGNCPDNVLAFLNQQYRWCAGTVGLLTGSKFWGAKLPLYTRICFVSGLIYYVYSSAFTFLVPAVSVLILAFVPQLLLFRNMIFMVPVLIYGAIIFPAWHRAPFRLESWAVRLIAGWAHFFAYWDGIRGKKLGWKPSGSGSKKQEGARRFWACFLVWSLGSSLAWTGLAFYRMLTMTPINFIVVFGLGLFELLITVRVLLQPLEKEHA